MYFLLRTKQFLMACYLAHMNLINLFDIQKFWAFLGGRRSNFDAMQHSIF